MDANANVRGTGTPDDPWILHTPSLQGEFQMVRDPTPIRRR